MMRLTLLAIALALTLTARAQEAEKTWQEKFDEVYKLDEGETLKRIAPPFIPERLTYYRTNSQSQAQAIPRGPDYICFHWTGRLNQWGMGFGYSGGLTLSQVMQDVIGLQNYEIDGDAKL